MEKSSSSAFQILGIYFLDFIIGVALYLMACLLGGIAHNTLTPDVDVLYIYWFAFSLFPFLLYARWRRVLDFDRWDVLFYSPIPLVIHLIGQIVPENSYVRAMLIGLILSFFIMTLSEVREKTFPRKSVGS